MTKEKESWDQLDMPTRNAYIARAEYLVDRGYVQPQDVIELARVIYEKEE